MAVTRSLMAFTSAKVHLSWLPSIGETERSPQEPDQGSKEGDQAHVPSSEPGIDAHGSHCVQGALSGAASIFQSCATLVKPAGYAVAICLKLSGKMWH